MAHVAFDGRDVSRAGVEGGHGDKLVPVRRVPADSRRRRVCQEPPVHDVFRVAHDVPRQVHRPGGLVEAQYGSVESGHERNGLLDGIGVLGDSLNLRLDDEPSPGRSGRREGNRLPRLSGDRVSAEVRRLVHQRERRTRIGPIDDVVVRSGRVAVVQCPGPAVVGSGGAVRTGHEDRGRERRVLVEASSRRADTRSIDRRILCPHPGNGIVAGGRQGRRVGIRPVPGSLRVKDSGLFALDVRRRRGRAGRQAHTAVVVVGSHRGPGARRARVLPGARDLAVRDRIRPIVLSPQSRRLEVRVGRHRVAQDVLEDRKP